jgi:hypothetical protein
MHRWQRLAHPSKQFWNWFCVMTFRAAVVLILISSMSSKFLLFYISFIFGNRRKSLGARSDEYGGCFSTVICLLAKNSRTDSAVWAGALSWCKIHELLAKSSGRFRLTFLRSLSVLPNSKHHQTILRFVSTAATRWQFANFIVILTPENKI